MAVGAGATVGIGALVAVKGGGTVGIGSGVAVGIVAGETGGEGLGSGATVGACGGCVHDPTNTAHKANATSPGHAFFMVPIPLSTICVANRRLSNIDLSRELPRMV